MRVLVFDRYVRLGTLLVGIRRLVSGKNRLTACLALNRADRRYQALAIFSPDQWILNFVILGVLSDDSFFICRSRYFILIILIHSIHPLTIYSIFSGAYPHLILLCLTTELETVQILIVLFAPV